MDYTVIRSSRRTMAIEVTRDARVLVRVPFSTPDERIDRFVTDHTAWIEAHVKARLARPTVELSDADIAALKRQAKAYIPERVAYYAKVMGLTPTGVTINAATTRFGSCGVTNRLNFSCRLMQYPKEAIDYVVVHELAHLRHRNHGREFYALIAQYLPDYRQRERMLR